MSFFSSDSAFWQQAWPLVGWTMLWFLASGTLVLIASAILRMALKRASSRARYATSLVGFAILAILPVLIAGYLAASLPRDIARSARPGFNAITNAEPANPIDLKNLPIVNRESKRVGDERSAEETTNLTNDTNKDFIIPGWDNHAILNAIVSYLPWLWLVGTPLTFLLLATGLIGAERLRKSCQTLTDGPILAACERVRAQLAIARHVGVSICHSISSPLLVGIVKPLILLPPAALTGWTTDELEMVLLHELAHVRRWDNAVNLLQRIVESLLFFHPATWIMSNWVRRDREDCCDAIVVGQTAKPQAYAELLLNLASQSRGLATSVAMAQHPIASRIRRILKIEDEPMLISRKGLTLGVGIVLATVLLAFALPASEAEEASLPRERGESEKVSREAERVADERSAEETTNPTNDTNKDLATEDTESTEEPRGAINADQVRINLVYALGPDEKERKEWFEIVKRFEDDLSVTTTGRKDRFLVSGTIQSHNKLKEILQNKSSKNSMFPTLEEQRAADFAYKLLGVELEKLGEEELARVKAKGYSGGLKVTGMGGSLNFGDILVGLHVWPTESLDQVQEILSRYDMHELSPLKFYVIRQRMTGGYGEGRDDMGNPTAPDPERDEVATGRLEVDLDAWAEKEGFKQERLNQSRILNDSGPAPPSWPQNNSDDNEQATLLYDGKTFDQWRDLWRQDLSTDFRIKAVHAFVAFANAGKGKEAVVEILAIVEQYDWSIIGTSHVDPLRNACIEVFTGSEIPKDMAIEAMVSSDVKNSRILQFLDYVAQPLSQWSKEGNDKLREAFSDRKIPEYVSPEKRKIGAGGGFGRGGYGVIQDITPPEPAARLIPLTPTGEQGLRTIIAPFNKKPVAGSRNTYQFFVLNATTATDSDVELSVEFPPGLVPDMASVKSPIGADLVDNEVKFRPIAMMRPNERISFQITASILKAGEGEIVAKFKSKDSPAKEVRKSVTVVDF